MSLSISPMTRKKNCTAKRIRKTPVDMPTSWKRRTVTVTIGMKKIASTNGMSQKVQVP